MHQVTRGLVIRTVDYRDADRILTVLSEDRGKITVLSRGVRRRASRLAAACQSFVWAEMTLFEHRGRYRLDEALVLEQFRGLERGLESLALAAYVAEVLGTEAEEAGAQPEILRLALNALHALAGQDFDRRGVKAAFELRYMALSGYQPDLGACGDCGAGLKGQAWFQPAQGRLQCARCPRGKGALPLDAGALEAARYILGAPLGRIFSFRLAESSLALLGDMAEKYLLACLERGFRTLDFYRGLV